MVGDQVISNVAVPLSLMRSSTAFRGVVMDDCLFGDLQVRNGQIVGMSPPAANAAVSGVVLPRLTEPHVHLDKCFTISRMTSAVNRFAAALTAQSEDKVNWTHGDAAHQAPFTWEAIGEIG